MSQAQVNTSFSELLPGLQLAVDSTSLGEFKTCPRKYYYSIIQGYQPKQRSFHLTFGILYHGALERYDHKKFEGRSHEESLDFAIDWTLRQTWNSQMKKPWISGDSNKNRLTLIRTIIDYADKFGQSDVLQTIRLENGKPAVELSFSFFSGVKSANTGEPFIFCGHMDRLASMNGQTYVSDRKTTSHTISGDWFKQFSPHNQFSLYLLAGQIVYKQQVKSLVVDGVQLAVSFSRFQRGIVQRTDDQLKEWHKDTSLTLRSLEECAKEGYWPQNDASCGNYGGCAFREVCGRSPSARQAILDLEFTKRIWDPLQRRGDI